MSTLHGRAVHTLVEGDAGIGKTRLLAEAASRARELGMQVVAGAADELDRSRPFAAVLSALEASAAEGTLDPAELSGLSSGGASDDGRSWSAYVPTGAGLPQRLLDVILGILERLALERPLALVLEDLHWADVPTLLAVRAVANRLGDVPLCLLMSRRRRPETYELGRFRAILEAAGTMTLGLGPLPEEAVVNLVVAVTGGRPGGVLSEQVAGAGGNPLLILELLRTLMDGGAVRRGGDGVTDIDRPQLPADLRGVLLATLGDLSSETCHLLRLASILGSHVTVGDLSLMSGQPVSALLPSIDEAMDAGILEPAANDTLAFHHELLRQVIYEELAPGVRRALHGQAGQALAAARAPALSVATHLIHAAGPGDDEAVSWLCEAAREARSSSPSVALELARRALAIAGRGDPRRGELSVTLVYALLWTGSVQEALSTIRHALHDSGLHASVKARLTLPLVWALLSADRSREALEVIGSSPASTGSASEDRLLMVAAACARLDTGDLAESASLAQAVVSSGEPVGDSASVVPALCLLSQLARLDGSAGRAVELARRALELGEGGGGEATRWPCDYVLACALVDSDELGEAREALWRGMERSRNEAGAWNLPLYQWKAAELASLTGRWDDAMSEVEAASGDGEETDLGFRGSREALGWRALIAVHRGDTRTARAAVRDGRGLSGCFVGAGSWQLARARALLEEIGDRHGAALAELERGWAEAAPVAQVGIGAILVNRLVARGEVEKARRRAAAVDAIAERMGSPWALATALRCRGLAWNVPELLLEAVARLRQTERPLELALACEDAGRSLASGEQGAGEGGGGEEGGDGGGAGVELLEEALALYDELGAEVRGAGVRALLRSLGVRRVRSGPRQARPSHGWESLTPTEARVAELVLDGLTSPQIAARLFVSRRTVETHVAHVFAKLGVRSRAALRAGPGAEAVERRSPSAAILRLPEPSSRLAEAAGRTAVRRMTAVRGVRAAEKDQ